MFCEAFDFLARRPRGVVDDLRCAADCARLPFVKPIESADFERVAGEVAQGACACEHAVRRAAKSCGGFDDVAEDDSLSPAGWGAKGDRGNARSEGGANIGDGGALIVAQD